MTRISKKLQLEQEMAFIHYMTFEALYMKTREARMKRVDEIWDCIERVKKLYRITE